jgi:hypothetical protein
MQRQPSEPSQTSHALPAAEAAATNLVTPETRTVMIDRIEAWMQSLRQAGDSRLDAEIGERLQRLLPVNHYLAILTDHACSGLDAHSPRIHGNLPAEPSGLYLNLLKERDTLMQRAILENRPITGTLDEHGRWLRQHTRHCDVMCAWVERLRTPRSTCLSLVPARGWLSRGVLYATHADPLSEADLMTLSYVANRLAQAIELRDRPYLSDLMTLRFTAREADVLRAGLRGEADESIGKRMGLSVDAIRYYFKKFKHRAPASIGHLKPRELARILHQLGKL